MTYEYITASHRISHRPMPSCKGVLVRVLQRKRINRRYVGLYIYLSKSMSRYTKKLITGIALCFYGG